MAGWSCSVTLWRSMGEVGMVVSGEGDVGS